MFSNAFKVILFATVLFSGALLTVLPHVPAVAADQTAQDSKEENADNAAAPDADPWKEEWNNQRQQLEDIAQTSKDLQSKLPAMIRLQNKKLTPVSADARRMYLLAGSYAANPRVLEALQNRFLDMLLEVKSIAAPLNEQKRISGELKEKIDLLHNTLPKDANLPPELRAFSKSLDQIRQQLASVNTRIESSLVPATILSQSLNKAATDIDGVLPELWKDHYAEGPENYWDPAIWKKLPEEMATTLQIISLRLPLELPGTLEDFTSSLLHFLLALGLCAALSLLLFKKLVTDKENPVIRHIFKRAIPWICLGIALVAASWNLKNTFWHSLLALGNVALIIGQISLAWDMRRYQHEELHTLSSPMWQIYPVTLASYILLYPSLPPHFVNMLWILIVIIAIAAMWRHPVKNIPLEPDNTLLRLQPVFLWLCLILGLLGMAVTSQILYLLYISCTVAVQLMLGAMQAIHSQAKDQPQEGLRPALISIAIAMAAPLVLLLVMAGMSLWICTLPGGLILIRHFAGTSVAVGQTSFSMFSLLLIISMFYLARAVIALGSTFLKSLANAPGQHLDSSLIQPVMTAFTYAVWAGFGLFVLHILGLELSSLAMVAGGLSVGIGFGLQNIVSNFLSGLILIFSRTLQEGDVIDVGGLTGTVRKISVRATMVETYDGAAIYVPNADFVSNRLINWTRNGRSTRREILVGVAYGSDTQLVMQTLKEAASTAENVMRFPLPVVLFKDFGGSTLDFRLLYWVRDFNAGNSTDSLVRLEIEKRFRDLGIEIAFPQLDVHLVPAAQEPPHNRSAAADAVSRVPFRRNKPRPRRPLPAGQKTSAANSTPGKNNAGHGDKNRSGRDVLTENEKKITPREKGTLPEKKSPDLAG